jgi:PIN domain nuclease of toxin-antitoxin system
LSLLLDTHVFAWLFLDDPRLPKRISALLEAYESDIYVSAISGYEMAQKLRLGKWAEARPLVEHFNRLTLEAHFLMLDVTPQHAIRAGLIPGKHRDPFDRMLVAQSMIEGLRLISADHGLNRLGVRPVW